MGPTSLANAEINRTTALFPNAIFVQWTITPDSNTSGPFIVKLARSGAPEGPWETVADSLLDTYQYLDKDFNLPPPDFVGDERSGLQMFSLSRDVYYQITVIPPTGPTFTSDPTPVEPGLDRRTRLFKRKILHDESTAFKHLNGIPIIALKRRHWGTRCRDCYDSDLREGTKEHCARCYGTTFEGGYWAPLSIRGRRSTQPVQTQMTSKGKSEQKVVTFTLLDYPHLEQDDVLVDLRRNERFIVRLVSPTELKTVIVHQAITASYIEHGAVEYDIKVDPRTVPSLY